jgi:holin-like protein
MHSWMKIVIQVIFLYMIYFLGVFLQNLFHLMIPGSIIGMIILFVLLQANFFQKEWVKDGSLFLVKYLSLLFIPATVGIMQYLLLFTSKGFITVIVVLISTVLVMISSSWICQQLSERKEDVNKIKERKYSG